MLGFRGLGVRVQTLEFFFRRWEEAGCSSCFVMAGMGLQRVCRMWFVEGSGLKFPRFGVMSASLMSED